MNEERKIILEFVRWQGGVWRTEIANAKIADAFMDSNAFKRTHSNRASRKGLGLLAVSPLPRGVPPIDREAAKLTVDQYFMLPLEARERIEQYRQGRRLLRAPRLSEIRAAYIEMVNRCNEYDVGDNIWHWPIALHVALARIVGVA